MVSSLITCDGFLIQINKGIICNIYHYLVYSLSSNLDSYCTLKHYQGIRTAALTQLCHWCLIFMINK